MLESKVNYFFTKDLIVWEYTYATLAEEEKTKKAKAEIGKSEKRKQMQSHTGIRPVWGNIRGHCQLPLPEGRGL